MMAMGRGVGDKDDMQCSGDGGGSNGEGGGSPSQAETTKQVRKPECGARVPVARVGMRGRRR